MKCALCEKDSVIVIESGDKKVCLKCTADLVKEFDLIKDAITESVRDVLEQLMSRDEILPTPDLAPPNVGPVGVRPTDAVVRYGVRPNFEKTREQKIESSNDEIPDGMYVKRKKPRSTGPRSK